MGPSKFAILLDRAATTIIIIYNNIFSQVGPSKFSILLDRAATTIIIYNNFFSQRGGAPAQEAHCTSNCTSEELRRPRLEKGQREAQGPW